MSDLVAIVYPSEAQAEAMRTKLFELQKDYLIELGDAVVAEKTADGKIKPHQMFNATAAGAASAASGACSSGCCFSFRSLASATALKSGLILMEAGVVASVPTRVDRRFVRRRQIKSRDRPALKLGRGLPRRAGKRPSRCFVTDAASIPDTHAEPARTCAGRPQNRRGRYDFDLRATNA